MVGSMKLQLPLNWYAAVLAALLLSVPVTADDWEWSGGSATWSDSSSAEWSNPVGSTPAGQAVTFSSPGEGTVSIDRVTPASISVTGGHYIFVPVSETSVGIDCSGVLSVRGDATLLEMKLANTELTGSVVFEGGQLVLGVEDALGSASLYFNGGQLVYAAGVTQDVSEYIHADSASDVRVDTGANSITWNDTDGVKEVLHTGIEKMGSGTLNLEWSANGETHTGAIQVNSGSLRISKVSGQCTLGGSVSGTGTLVLNSPSGQFNISGDNSQFSGIILLEGDGASNSGSVRFANGAAMGGVNTLVQVAGQRFWFNSRTTTDASLEIVEGTSTYFDGSTGLAYTFTGAVSGGGELIVKPSCAITMSGDVSAFTGRFQHPGATAVSWIFGGEGITGYGEVQAELNSTEGNMIYTFWYGDATVLSGAVTGTAKLRQRGAGVLTLTAQNTSTGNLEIDTGAEVQLGTATTAASWSGSTLSGGGTFTLVNGALLQGLNSVRGVLVADVAAGAVVDMGGSSAGLLQRIAIGAGGRLCGVSGDVAVPELELTLGAANVGSGAVPAGGEQYMIEIEDGNLIIADPASVSLDMETIKSIINGKRQAVYLHICNTAISLTNGVTAESLFANSATSPAALGLVVLGVEGGNIVLEGAVRDIYVVGDAGDYPTVTSYTRLQDYKATFIDTGYTLSLQLAGDDTQAAWVNNLLGSGDFVVSNTDEAAGVVRVLLNNAVLGDVEGSLPPDELTQINTANTTLEGSVTAGRTVQLVKTGSGVLSIGGTLTADWLEIEEGTLRLTGSGSSVESLHGSGSLQVNGSLSINGDALNFDGNLAGDGEMLLNGSLRGSGMVGSLGGSGHLQAVGDTFTVKNTSDATFSGSLDTGSGAGVLSVLPGAGTMTLERVQSTRDWSIQNSGSMVLQQAGSSNSILTLGTLQLLDDSSTTLVLNTDANADVLHLESLLVADGASVTLSSTGSALIEEERLVLGQTTAADLGADERVPLILGSGFVLTHLSSAWLTVENGDIVLHTLAQTRNLYADAAGSHNGRAGARLLWNLPGRVLSEAPDLNAVIQTLDALLTRGKYSAADELMASAAGAAAAPLGAAVMGDMERQLKAIRNRTTSMGLNPAYVYDNLPLFNAWVNAEGDYTELSSSGTDGGYRLSSWGGTVGVDADFSTALTAGLALTAMYGDYESRGSARADGDMDTCYLTLFGRYVCHRWVNTLVVSAGLADIELNRRVNYGNGSYRTHGSTHGTSLGLLYELGYVIPLDEDNRSCLQPLVNISYRYAEVDSYREHGSDAALHLGRQSMDVFSFGLGARAQTYALENLYNRSCLLEARLLLRMDAGDRRSRSRVGFLELPAYSDCIRSAERGGIGLEMGAGMIIPLGAESGQLFLDAGFEFRSDWMEVNGTLGYRMNF